MWAGYKGVTVSALSLGLAINHTNSRISCQMHAEKHTIKTATVFIKKKNVQFLSQT